MKVFTINDHGSHYGQVTCAISINFLSNFPRRLTAIFGFDWLSGFRKMFENNGNIHVMYLAPRQSRGRQSPGVNVFFFFFKNTIIQ